MEIASRIDAVTGVRYEVRFLLAQGTRMLSLATLPADPPRAGVVICSPVFAEFTRNYRRESTLASELASRGLAVLRLQYRGTANSDGESSGLTFGTMTADVRSAIVHLVDDLGVSEVGVLGTRLGGLVAAAVAGDIGTGPLVLWEPVVDPTSYFKDIFRAKLMSDLKAGARQAGSGVSLLEELRSTGSVDMLGYEIQRRFHDSVEGHDLGSELTGGPRSILLVQFGGGRGDLRPDYRAVADRWELAGARVRREIFAGHETWWFADDSVDKTALGSQPLIDLTSDWLLAEMASRSAP